MHSDAKEKKSSPQLVLWLGMTAVWLALLASTFWYFYFDDIRQFDPAAPYSESQRETRQKALLDWLALLGVPVDDESPQFLHILSNQCHCDSYAIAYLANLSSEQQHWLLAEAGVLGELNSSKLKSSSPLNTAERLAVSDSDFKAIKQWVKSTPALLIVRSGKVQYVGPHSTGYNCGDGANYIDLYNNNLTAGFEEPLSNLTQRGCYCSL